ncbi:MAG: DNA alkylation repair protein [Luteitalea sp.]|nr:DNA alkylation repair protein [Luteitalea sp.]
MHSKPNRALIADVRERLAQAADPDKAAPMQAYMKSAMPYHGVQMPGVRAICRQLLAEYPIDNRNVWEATVRALFDQARHREERSVAIELSGHRPYRRWQDVDTLPLYDHLIVTGAWWDLVDEVAIRRVGPILLTHPEQVRPILLRWAHDQDIWRRRTAIISQIKAVVATDTKLLKDCIRPNLAEKGFFIRKGIGWALREHAKTDPEWVRSYVERHRATLSPLSVREALKNI